MGFLDKRERIAVEIDDWHAKRLNGRLGLRIVRIDEGAGLDLQVMAWSELANSTED